MATTANVALCATIPPAAAKALRALARERGVSASSIVRAAVCEVVGVPDELLPGRPCGRPRKVRVEAGE